VVQLWPCKRPRPRPVPAPSRPGLREKRELAGMAARGVSLACGALEERARGEVLGSSDLLERIAAHVAEDDLLVWSLVCRGFLGAQRSAGRKLVTPRSGMATSVRRVEWALQEQLGVVRYDVCELAAAGGHLDVLKWARGAGCEWDEFTCSAAGRAGYLDVLKWAVENGCPCFDQHRQLLEDM